MPKKLQERQHFSEILEYLKKAFPSPVSNPVMDGYFVHTLFRFLDRVDDLKSAAPVLGRGLPGSYRQVLEEGFPEEMRSVEEVTAELVDFCRGMPVWGHPNSQVNVIPPATISSITAVMAAALLNPNIIWDEYAARFAEAEIQAVAMPTWWATTPGGQGGCSPSAARAPFSTASNWGSKNICKGGA